jgi:DNA-binding PucR family transcriptional regulator
MDVPTPPRRGAIEDLLARLGPHESLDDFERRHLGPIAAYDRDRGTSLIETLATFLDVGTNLEATAVRLGTHRNTIRYRLRRITDLTGHDPHDPQVAFEMHLALRIRGAREASGSTLHPPRVSPAR